jgi:adenylate cyclase
VSTKVHYEVHVLEGNRWSFLSRYPGNEREEAMSDARQAEIRLGRPTKVVRDTFYTELNYSEETVAYMSPNAKGRDAHAAEPAHRKRSQPDIRYRPKRGYSSSYNRRQQTRAPSTTAPSSTTDSSFLVRLILVLIASIVIAAALTAALGFFLNALKNFDIYLPERINAQIAIYWYIAMFLLASVALNKAYVPWRHLFRKVKAHREDRISTKNEREKRAVSFALKPKNSDPFKDAREEKERLEIKILRGDPDVTPDPYEVADTKAKSKDAEAVAFNDPARVSTEHVSDATATPEPTPVTGDEEDDVQASDTSDRQPEDDAPEDVRDESERTEIGQTPLTEMGTERLYMVRFLGDTVMSLRGSQDQLGPETRFGVSLYLAGAASILSDRHGLTPDAEQSILSDALHLIGSTEAERRSFFENYNDHMSAKRNGDIIHAGEAAMMKSLSDTDRPSAGLDALLQKWSKPASPLPEIKSVFLLTYANTHQGGSASVDDYIVRHNRMVRVAIAEQDGEEVRHTGKGIFAKFASADDAICAAIVMQKERERLKKSASPPPQLRIALAASLITDSDPEISGSVFSFADSLCRRLRDGQIACDELVKQTCTISDVTFDRSIPTAHSGIGERGRAVEILWEPVPA